jgi:hypothetical protein
VQTPPHVDRLARLLHNRVVRRVHSAFPRAHRLLLVGDLVDGQIHLHPVEAWDISGTVLRDGSAGDPAEPDRWHALVEDLRPDFALLGRTYPVELFEPYLLELRQLDLGLEATERRVNG